jgi:hypothetical protein
MKIQLRQGSESHTIKAQSFKRAYLLIQSVGNTVLDAPTDLDVNLSKINITLELFQGNQLYTSSFNGVAPVALGAMKQRAFESVRSLDFAANGLSCRGQVIQPNTSTEVYLNNVFIPLLWGGYNIKEDDYFKVIVNTNPGFFGGDNTNASSFYLVTEESTDVNQVDVNIPYYYPITIDKTNPQFSEAACSEIYTINTAPYTFATQPFQSVEIRSKYVNDRFDNYTLETKTREDGEGRTYDLGSNLIYNVEPSTLEDVQINLDINTAVVTNGAQWLFVSRTGYSTILLEKAADREIKINVAKGLSRGLNAVVSGRANTMGYGKTKFNVKPGRPINKYKN